MTYSILARCPRTNAFGIAIASSSICVASAPGLGPLGAVATRTSPIRRGPAGLAVPGRAGPARSSSCGGRHA